MATLNWDHVPASMADYLDVWVDGYQHYYCAPLGSLCLGLSLSLSLSLLCQTHDCSFGLADDSAVQAWPPNRTTPSGEPKDVAAWRATGKAYWQYWCIGPGFNGAGSTYSDATPYPQWWLNSLVPWPAIAPRLIPWLAALNNVSGLLYWVDDAFSGAPPLRRINDTALSTGSCSQYSKGSYGGAFADSRLGVVAQACT